MAVSLMMLTTCLTIDEEAFFDMILQQLCRLRSVQQRIGA
jgi:hypothetical protein